MYEAGALYSGPWLADAQLGNTPHPLGNRHPQMAPHGVYACRGADQWLAVACRDDDDWQRLCRVVGGTLREDLNLAQRQAAHAEIDAAFEQWTSQHSKQDATRILRAAGIPAGAVATTPDMLADAQIAQRGYFVPLEQDMPVPGVPYRMAACPGGDWRKCPPLGADNAAGPIGVAGFCRRAD